MSLFQTEASITLRTTLTVEADSEDEARDKFKQAEWEDEGTATWAPTMEMVDWESGDFKEVDEYGNEQETDIPMTLPGTYTAHHPKCPVDMEGPCTCGGPGKPFYPRRECVKCGRVVKLCRCKHWDPAKGEKETDTHEMEMADECGRDVQGWPC